MDGRVCVYMRIDLNRMGIYESVGRLGGGSTEEGLNIVNTYLP